MEIIIAGICIIFGIMVVMFAIIGFMIVCSIWKWKGP